MIAPAVSETPITLLYIQENNQKRSSYHHAMVDSLCNYYTPLVALSVGAGGLNETCDQREIYQSPACIYNAGNP